MTDKTYKRAVEIKEKLKEIDSFLWYMDKVREVSFTHKKPKTIFSTTAYGALHSESIECSGELANRLKNVMREYRDEIAKEYEMLK